jgi:DNA-directed RNA polymerase subunit RPC12/RpoP
MTLEEDLDEAGRGELDRKTNRYRCPQCGTIEILSTHGEEPECTRCGSRLVLEP